MSDIVLRMGPLGFPWVTEDPFLFCVHHDDAYPRGNERLGPAASLAGRNIGQDFEGRDGWRMYHGDVVPGFPQHPHRGFETVTIVRRGFVDHSDSLGATARFGQGDVQWLTAGRGILHSEMFPLLDPKGPNPLELFQIWLNLPSSDKMVEPHFSMLWSDALARHTAADVDGNKTELTIVAGTLAGAVPPPAPPHSWASRPDTDVAIATISMAPHARFTLPRAKVGTNRTLFFFRGESLELAGHAVRGKTAVKVRSDADIELANGPAPSELLLLQGKPIGEEVVQYGPFVMNSRAEIQQAIADYQRTGFGGWPWPNHGPVHAQNAGRFAEHADGRRENAR
jgi:redox-sensitive bicupin YhaK (pirin superfamily)